MLIFNWISFYVKIDLSRIRLQLLSMLRKWWFLQDTSLPLLSNKISRCWFENYHKFENAKWINLHLPKNEVNLQKVDDILKNIEKWKRKEMKPGLRNLFGLKSSFAIRIPLQERRKSPIFNKSKSIINLNCLLRSFRISNLKI